MCRKLIKKLFFAHSVLLLVPASAFHAAVCYSSPLAPAFLPAQFAYTLHDTTKLVSVDSSAAKAASASIGLNKHVVGFVHTYIKKEADYLEKIKRKSSPYFRVFETVFEKNNLPKQLKYLAVVESDLRTMARSNAGARGVWQLMPQTAVELGLRIKGNTDERLHTQRSTVAAAKYLQSLYSQFGDWLLVLAAYNSGPGPVYKAIKKAGSKNFWALQRFLPAESRGHVKRFIGIHYFFEGGGSIATQTKAEAKAWQKKVDEAEKAAGNDTVPEPCEPVPCNTVQKLNDCCTHGTTATAQSRGKIPG